MSQENASLELCNLVSGGMSLKEARQHLVKKANEETVGMEKKETKLSAADKKQLLKAEIEALGYEAPEENSSVAKFEETLAAAKEEIALEEEKGKDLL